MTTKQAIEQVMTGKRKPMTVAEIAEAAIPLSTLRVRGAEAGHLLRPVLGEQAPRRARDVHRQGDVQAQPEAAEGVTDLAALARESYADDVEAVAGELAQASDAAAFTAALRELVETLALHR